MPPEFKDLREVREFFKRWYSAMIENDSRAEMSEDIAGRHIASLPTYANDAAAGAAGLVAGDLYTETGTDPLRLAVKS